jgi:hypothetical protein
MIFVLGAPGSLLALLLARVYNAGKDLRLADGILAICRCRRCRMQMPTMRRQMEITASARMEMAIAMPTGRKEFASWPGKGVVASFSLICTSATAVDVRSGKVIATLERSVSGCSLLQSREQDLLCVSQGGKAGRGCRLAGIRRVSYMMAACRGIFLFVLRGIVGVVVETEVSVACTSKLWSMEFSFSLFF